VTTETSTTTTTVVTTVVTTTVPQCIFPQDLVTVDGQTGLDVTFFETEKENMRGRWSVTNGITVAAPAFTSQLHLMTEREDSSLISELLTTVGPKTLAAGETVNTSLFVAINSTDERPKRFALEVDRGGVVTETDEEYNTYHLDLQLCWPADLTLRPSFTIMRARRPGYEQAWGQSVCLTPTMVDSVSPGATADVILRMVYQERNEGSRSAANWTNVIHWDGEQVISHGPRPVLEPGEQRDVQAEINLGLPDQGMHLLEIWLDVNTTLNPWGEVHGDQPEAYENNNYFNLTVRFCDWGAELQAGPNLTIGTQQVQWGDVVCLTDEDIIAVNMQTVCTEGGCQMSGADENLVYLEYQEVNAGAQLASAESAALGGWTNTLFYDGDPAIINAPQLELEANSSRRVFAMGINRYGVDAVVFQPYDLNPHNLTLQLDSGKEVAWRFPGPQLNYTVELRFCTTALQAASGGECGCAGDLTAPSLMLGGHNVTVSTSEMAHICLTPADMNADRSFNVSYQEANAQRASLLDIGGNFRNELFWDGAWLAVSEPRPLLSVGAVRHVPWAEPIQLWPDRRSHVLQLVLDSPSAGFHLAPQDPLPELQPELDNDNNYAVNVTFCGFKPDLTPGPLVYVGRQAVPWGGTVCLSAEAGDIVTYNAGNGESRQVSG
jgi:hypothetical protein